MTAAALAGEKPGRDAIASALATGDEGAPPGREIASPAQAPSVREEPRRISAGAVPGSLMQPAAPRISQTPNRDEPSEFDLVESRSLVVEFRDPLA
jgi:hypothetical protein